jgi:stage II sporulation protein AA (anti-sigma F factor antagonist)
LILATSQRLKDSASQPDILVETHKIEKTGETRVVVSGEIDLATVSAVENVLQDLQGQVVLDLRKVGFMDSQGIRLILTHRERLNGEGGHLRIVANGGPITRVIDLAGLTGVIDVEPSLYPEQAPPAVPA